MSSLEYLKEFVNERLTAVAEEIFGVFKRTIDEYEEELVRQRKMLAVVRKLEITGYNPLRCFIILDNVVSCVVMGGLLQLIKVIFLFCVSALRISTGIY